MASGGVVVAAPSSGNWPHLVSPHCGESNSAVDHPAVAATTGGAAHAMTMPFRCRHCATLPHSVPMPAMQRNVAFGLGSELCLCLLEGKGGPRGARTVPGVWLSHAAVLLSGDAFFQRLHAAIKTYAQTLATSPAQLGREVHLPWYNNGESETRFHAQPCAACCGRVCACVFALMFAAHGLEDV